MLYAYMYQQRRSVFLVSAYVLVSAHVAGRLIPLLSGIPWDS